MLSREVLVTVENWYFPIVDQGCLNFQTWSGLGIGLGAAIESGDGGVIMPVERERKGKTLVRQLLQFLIPQIIQSFFLSLLEGFRIVRYRLSVKEAYASNSVHSLYGNGRWYPFFGSTKVGSCPGSLVKGRF